MFCFIAEAEEVAIRNIIACMQIGVTESSSSSSYLIVDKVRCKMFVA